jgi:TatA/E family protein of Tat protein translocase
MFGVSVPELMVVLVMALLIVGPRKLPPLARAIGRGLRELQRAMRSFDDWIADDEDPPPPPAAPPLPSLETPAAEPSDTGRKAASPSACATDPPAPEDREA